MRTEDIIWISAISFFIGALFFAYLQGWLIIRSPHNSLALKTDLSNNTVSKKKVKLFYWYNDSWHTEETELLWSDYKADNIYYLINSLLSVMHEEEALNKKVSLETAMLSPNGAEAFLSFNRNPFRKDVPTFEKWMIIESILKTISENETNVKEIRFLVHHKPLSNYHLDFANSWHINHGI